MNEHISRRAFLIGTLSVAAVAVTPMVLASPAAAATAGANSHSSRWKRSTYTPLVGKTFTIAGSSSSFVLSQVADLVPAATSGAQDQFSLLFTSAGGQLLPQATYDLNNASLGTVSLFLVPVGPGTTHKYLAIINRAT